jgi:hypothetical protein
MELRENNYFEEKFRHLTDMTEGTAKTLGITDALPQIRVLA